MACDRCVGKYFLRLLEYTLVVSDRAIVRVAHRAIASHILEQPPCAGDSTSFGVHTDTQDEQTSDAVATVVIKLSHANSHMYIETHAKI